MKKEPGFTDADRQRIKGEWSKVVPPPVKLTEEVLEEANDQYEEIKKLIERPERRLAYKPSNGNKYFDIGTSQRLDAIQARFRAITHNYLDYVIDLETVLKGEARKPGNVVFSEQTLENVLNIHFAFINTRLDAKALINPDEDSYQVVIEKKMADLNQYTEGSDGIVTDIDAIARGDPGRMVFIHNP